MLLHAGTSIESRNTSKKEVTLIVTSWFLYGALAATDIGSTMDIDAQVTQATRRELRREQMFPALTQAEIDRMRKFGEVRAFGDGKRVIETGKPHPGMLVVLSGRISITQRDGFGNVRHRADHDTGHFVAEIGQISGRVALVDGHAVGDVNAVVVSPENLRALMLAEAELGERIMRALILRRVSLIEEGAGGPVIIGASTAAEVIHLQGFLRRNGVPHHLLAPGADKDAEDIVARYSTRADELPLVVMPDGTVLKNPSLQALAKAVGMFSHIERGKLYDVAVVGCGPAGLSTAVYAASEGLSVVVCDSRSFGGQAGASARIENYFGFPTGISGLALVARAFNQAQKFGAEMRIPVAVSSLDCERKEETFTLSLDDGDEIKARSVVVASGARYRRPDIRDLSKFEGNGVWYWASPIEAKLCRDQEVILVGGGNSAGQAAVFLAGHARTVRMMVRGSSLAASMSRYLIERIEATSNIELLFNTEIAGLEGTRSGGLDRVRWREGKAGDERSAPVRNLFLFVGAEPATGWLKSCGVALDQGGFVITGGQTAGQSGRPLETTVPGIFAIGDARSGSIKRVGGAIGEGAQVVAALHDFLAATADA